jgi:hypothetical protein
VGQAIDELVTSVGREFVDETLDQITGHSRRKWALVLLAFIAGAAVTAVFVRRAQARRAAPPAATIDAGPAAGE